MAFRTPTAGSLQSWGGALWAAVHGVTKSQTRLRDFTFTLHFHALEKEMTQADLGHAALGLLRPCTAPGHPARTPGGNKDKHSCQQGLAPSRDLEEGKFHEESKPRLGHMSHLEGMSPC